MKEYEITFKFSDIIQTIEAESLEEAQKEADKLLEGDQTPYNDTQCYDLEIEEVFGIARICSKCGEQIEQINTIPFCIKCSKTEEI